MVLLVFALGENWRKRKESDEVVILVLCKKYDAKKQKDSYCMNIPYFANCKVQIVHYIVINSFANCTLHSDQYKVDLLIIIRRIFG